VSVTAVKYTPSSCKGPTSTEEALFLMNLISEQYRNPVTDFLRQLGPRTCQAEEDVKKQSCQSFHFDSGCKDTPNS
jgi:hypothetical protein